MAKVLISPGKYVQGAGEMKKLGEYAQNYGKKALILISKGGYKRIGAMVEKSFEGKECGYVFDYFNGECSKKEIKRLGEIVKKEACDVVIGIGGGKIFDTAKAVAYYEKTPVLICPTIASTDAPCSALSVIIRRQGKSFDTLMEEGVKAKLALEAGACTEAVEKVIEANTLLSGIGFESGGLAGAHAIHNGLTVLEECHHMYHGEKVAFGTITQLVLENIPSEELQQVIDFCIECGLPVTLEQLGAGKITEEQLMKVAEAACAETDTLHNMPFEVTPKKVADAIKAADAYGHYFLGE